MFVFFAFIFIQILLLQVCTASSDSDSEEAPAKHTKKRLIDRTPDESDSPVSLKLVTGAKLTGEEIRKRIDESGHCFTKIPEENLKYISRKSRRIQEVIISLCTSEKATVDLIVSASYEGDCGLGKVDHRKQYKQVRKFLGRTIRDFLKDNSFCKELFQKALDEIKTNEHPEKYRGRKREKKQARMSVLPVPAPTTSSQLVGMPPPLVAMPVYLGPMPSAVNEEAPQDPSPDGSFPELRTPIIQSILKIAEEMGVNFGCFGAESQGSVAESSSFLKAKGCEKSDEEEDDNEV